MPKELEQALAKAFALQDVLARHSASAQQSSVASTQDEDYGFDADGEEELTDQNISSGVNNDQAAEEPAWVLSSGDLTEEQKPVPAIEKDPRSQWDFRIGKNGVIEHFRTEDHRVAVCETGDKIQILDQDHDSMALALERALERFGTYLNFDGNQAGARTLVDIVVTHDLRVTFTDDRLNAQIQVRRAHNDLDRGRPILTSEREQTPAKKRDAGDASVSTPEKHIAGTAASQQSEVLVEHGEAPFDYDKNNRLSYFVRTITETGQERLYWGKDLPRALEEAGAKVGDSILPGGQGVGL